MKHTDLQVGMKVRFKKKILSEDWKDIGRPGNLHEGEEEVTIREINSNNFRIEGDRMYCFHVDFIEDNQIKDYEIY